jgi:CTP:molybdopterin cytidylyltransferase MocA
MTIAAVVLAAGEGSRFAGQGHKLLTELRGKPLVVWAVEHALEAGLDETIVIEGAVDLAAVVPDEVTLVRNDDWRLGQAVSLQVAVQYASMMGHEAIVVGLGDMPSVPASTWRELADYEHTALIATASFDGHRSPPVRLDGAVWPLLPMTGDEGARPLIRSRPDLVVDVACEGQSLDIDTVEDMDQWS